MKKRITLLGILLAFAIVTFTAIAQKDKENKGKGNKEQGPKDKDKGNNNKDKSDKNNNGNNNEDKGKGNSNGKSEDDKDKGKDDKDDNGKDKDDAKRKMKDGFKWDRETFRDRDNIRKSMDKVTICHKPGKNGDPGVTLRVSSNALKAHLGHGDVEGDCPAVSNSVYSDDFLKRRTDYYTVLQNGQEQVLYSRSILDYALERLTGARSQLVVLQNSNAPAADIERKRLLVVDLEQNVSLLQTLVGVTANLIANKLVD